MALKQNELFARRLQRNRAKLRRVSFGRMRLTVFRSEQHIYAQVIDDTKGVTLAAASTVEPEAKGKLKDGKGCNIEAAALVGKLVAERARKAGVEAVFFDRGAYIFHGRVKALADAAREGGLKF